MIALDENSEDRVGHVISFPAVFDSQGYSHRAVTNLQQFSLVSSAFAIGIGLTVLAGWALELAALTSVLPGFVAMNPTTAICFMLLGAGVWLETRAGHRIRLAGSSHYGNGRCYCRL